MILSAVTALGYSVVIQFKRGGLWRLLAIPGALVLALNVIANFTELTLSFGRPKKWGDWTISARVRRMQFDQSESPSRRELARLVQVFLDACEPDGKH